MYLAFPQPLVLQAGIVHQRRLFSQRNTKPLIWNIQLMNMILGWLDSIKTKILPDSLPIPFVLESLPRPTEGPSEKQAAASGEPKAISQSPRHRRRRLVPVSLPYATQWWQFLGEDSSHFGGRREGKDVHRERERERERGYECGGMRRDRGEIEAWKGER